MQETHRPDQRRRDWNANEAAQPVGREVALVYACQSKRSWRSYCSNITSVESTVIDPTAPQMGPVTTAKEDIDRHVQGDLKETHSSLQNPAPVLYLKFAMVLNTRIVPPGDQVSEALTALQSSLVQLKRTFTGVWIVCSGM